LAENVDGCRLRDWQLTLTEGDRRGNLRFGTIGPRRPQYKHVPTGGHGSEHKQKQANE
jgi:hypothetical protein